MSIVSKELDGLIHQIASRDGGAAPDGSYASHPLLARLKALGSELWIDTGDLELARSIWKSDLTALTTNNTLANQVVQSGVMDQVIEETVRKVREHSSELSQQEMVREIGFVINCRIALRLVEAFQVKVSVELHPAMARDLEKSLIYGRRYFRVCPEFFTVKVPLTPEGLLAVRKLRRENIPINFTLGFSARQNYLAARLANPNFVNVFLGRLNQVVIDNDLGSGDLVGEQVTLATQRVLIRLRKEHPEVKSRLIGASIRNGEQLACLAGVDVLTIPPKAMKEFLESGKNAQDVNSRLEETLNPGVKPEGWGLKCKDLWEVPEAFAESVEELMRSPDLDDFTGGRLVEFFEKKEIPLFHRFSPADLSAIQDHGKIPRLSAWPDSTALDDLMTQSALQSFSKDQDALDARIASFLK
ncbi:MAG: transaldolase family protein [Nitrospinaceae bacterium]